MNIKSFLWTDRKFDNRIVSTYDAVRYEFWRESEIAHSLKVTDLKAKRICIVTIFYSIEHYGFRYRLQFNGDLDLEREITKIAEKNANYFIHQSNLVVVTLNTPELFCKDVSSVERIFEDLFKLREKGFHIKKGWVSYGRIIDS